ncbi:hypothetical protein ACIQWV_27675 [Streptomyces sp. NPDC098085]|uniref:hypothetical protein n=1 Tax=unclassified Streptomyces TaxID=2593676 RepID=UPI0038081120
MRLLSALFVLPALGDKRRWHWEQPQEQIPETPTARLLALIGTSGLIMLRLQMVVVYFRAAVAKLPSASAPHHGSTRSSDQASPARSAWH